MLYWDNGEGPYRYEAGTGLTNVLDYPGDIVLAIDPGKTNMSLIIGTPWQEVLAILEFSGNNRKKGPTQDTTVYCNEFRDFMKQYIGKATIFRGGVEKAITKKGMEYHTSSMVLTEIRGNVLNVFWDHFNVKMMEVNNWSWKSHILPEGYRSQSIKGSKPYLTSLPGGDIWNKFYECDVTDCMCIYLHITNEIKSHYHLACKSIEKPLHKMSYFLIPNLGDKLALPFTYNYSFSMSDNAAYVTNRSSYKCVSRVRVKDLHLEDIYGHSILMGDDSLEEVDLVACRC